MDILKDDLHNFQRIIDYLSYFLNKIQNLYPSSFKNKEQRVLLLHNDLSLEAIRERLIELENFIIKGVLSSYKQGNEINFDEKIGFLNQKNFDLEKENKNFQEQLRTLLHDKECNEAEMIKQQEIKKMKELENRLMEVENKLTSIL